MELSEKIFYLRESNGLTQEQFGAIFSVKRQTVYKWEKNITTPQSFTLELIADYFSVPLIWLIDNKYDLDDLASFQESTPSLNTLLDNKKEEAVVSSSASPLYNKGGNILEKDTVSSTSGIASTSRKHSDKTFFSWNHLIQLIQKKKGLVFLLIPIISFMAYVIPATVLLTIPLGIACLLIEKDTLFLKFIVILLTIMFFYLLLIFVSTEFGWFLRNTVD